MLLSSETKNKEVYKLFKGKTYIETNIKLFTEIDENLNQKFYNRLELIEPTLKQLNLSIEDIVIDNFEENSCIAEINSSVKGKLDNK